jgi:hypothetical protein
MRNMFAQAIQEWLNKCMPQWTVTWEDVFDICNDLPLVETYGWDDGLFVVRFITGEVCRFALPHEAMKVLRCVR